jgi:hypothetical protein
MRVASPMSEESDALAVPVDVTMRRRLSVTDTF